jgi:proteic killer suppression protein
LYYEEKGAHKYPAEVVDAFFEKMSIIEAAIDLRDLYALKSLHFEKLKGTR